MENIQSLCGSCVALTGCFRRKEAQQVHVRRLVFLSFEISFLVISDDEEMCQSTTKGMSPLPVKLAKITVILIFFCFAECAAGSCLSYGHACWGAHGKRSQPPSREAPPSRDLSSTRWFLSRLAQTPLDLHYLNGRDVEIPLSQRGVERQLFPDTDMEADPLKGQENYRNFPELVDDENVLLDEVYPHQRTSLNNRMKIVRALESRAGKAI